MNDTPTLNLGGERFQHHQHRLALRQRQLPDLLAHRRRVVNREVQRFSGAGPCRPDDQVVKTIGDGNRGHVSRRAQRLVDTEDARAAGRAGKADVQFTVIVADR